MTAWELCRASPPPPPPHPAPDGIAKRPQVRILGMPFHSPYLDLTTSTDSWRRNKGKDFILDTTVVEARLAPSVICKVCRSPALYRLH